MIEALVRELFAVQRENEPISPSSQPRKRFQFQTGVAQQRRNFQGCRNNGKRGEISIPSKAVGVRPELKLTTI